MSQRPALLQGKTIEKNLTADDTDKNPDFIRVIRGSTWLCLKVGLTDCRKSSLI